MIVRIAGRALQYFAIVFAARFALGVVRTLFVVPLIGPRYAELGETPLMLVVIFFTARFLVRRAPASMRPPEWLAVGGLALSLLLLTEFSAVLWLRNMPIEEYFATRDPVTGGVYCAALVAFALCPWIVFRQAPPTHEREAR